jgi:hypothetical protein
MRLIIFFFFFCIISISLVSAFDCSYFENEEDCLALLEVNESLIANLIYQSNNYPDFDFVENYNSEISVDFAPEEVSMINRDYIKNLWFTVLSVQPSILYQDELFVDSNFKLRSTYDYGIYVPPTYYNNEHEIGEICKIKYYLQDSSQNYKLYINNNLITTNSEQTITINNDATLNPRFTVSVTIKKKIYEWKRRNHRWRCSYKRTRYSTNTETIQEQIQVRKYSEPEEPSFTFIYDYNNMHSGNITEYDGNIKLSFENSEYITNKYEYQAEFTNYPYYFLQLKIINSSSQSMQNIYYNNDLLALANNNQCSLEYTNFFNSYTKSCEEDYQELILEPFELREYSANWTFFLYLLVFVAVNYGIYVLIKKYYSSDLFNSSKKS